MNTGTLQRRSDWDLDTPVDEAGDWKRFAACLDDYVRFEAWLPTQYAIQAGLAHICRAHCPVLAECKDYTALYKQTDGVVQAGKKWTSGRPADLADPGCGPHCMHLRRRP